MQETLTRWNQLDPEHAAEQILPCCGSRAWAAAMVAARPFLSSDALCAASDLAWSNASRQDWLEAFASHPRIGQRHAVATPQSLAWSAGEQEEAIKEEGAKAQLAEANRRYEDRFGRIFLVFATGKTATEMLTILEHRLKNDPETEIHEAAEQQRQITQLRLLKWLGGK